MIGGCGYLQALSNELTNGTSSFLKPLRTTASSFLISLSYKFLHGGHVRGTSSCTNYLLILQFFRKENAACLQNSVCVSDMFL